MELDARHALALMRGLAAAELAGRVIGAGGDIDTGMIQSFAGAEDDPLGLAALSGLPAPAPSPLPEDLGALAGFSTEAILAFLSRMEPSQQEAGLLSAAFGAAGTVSGVPDPSTLVVNLAAIPGLATARAEPAVPARMAEQCAGMTPEETAAYLARVAAHLARLIRALRIVEAQAAGQARDAIAALAALLDTVLAALREVVPPGDWQGADATGRRRITL
ncbi:hypothetical protein [Marivita sp. GX14005]|uniref:hypothetical protein n=1 Tax=Marivita sp. GX14005 TaxID=2942276 RepID=UPI0020194F91|nr:hypothetical protein [Marivita sp. GX14005]MCL3883296.1 hypothetical protein [Marivita sp. GX14005]